MAFKVITPPVGYPVTLEQAKDHLNVDHDDYDDLIESFIAAATDDAEDFTGLAFLEQTLEVYLDAFPSIDAIKLPKGPVIEIEAVEYQNSDGDWVAADAAVYVVDNVSHVARLTLANGKSWPSPVVQANSVRVRYRAGFVKPNSPAEANVPPAIIAAIKLMVGTLYANRESVVIGQTATMMPWAAEQLLRRKRIHTAIA